MLFLPLQGNVRGVGDLPRGNTLPAPPEFQSLHKLNARWLDQLLVTAQVLKETSLLASFPGMIVAAGITLEVLRMIQGAKQNQDEFQGLARSLVRTIQAIGTTIMANRDDDCSTSYIMEKCQRYLEFLTVNMVRISQFIRDTQTWRWFMNYTSIRRQIMIMKKDIDDMRSIFTETTLVDLYFHVNRLPKELSMWNSQPIRLIDAMSLTLDIPKELCATRDDFHDFLIFIFRKRRGRSYVERKQYDLTDALFTNRPLRDDVWSFKVQPGVTLLMNIILKRNITEFQAVDSVQCPICQSSCPNAFVGDEVTCLCGTLFHVSQGFNEEISRPNSTSDSSQTGDSSTHSTTSCTSPSRRLSRQSYSSKHSDPMSTDITEFRRFRICRYTSPTRSPSPSPSNVPPSPARPPRHVLKLNPILEPPQSELVSASDALSGQPLLHWNMLTGLDRCELSPASCVSWDKAREEPALVFEGLDTLSTLPPPTRFTVRFEGLPAEWTLDLCATHTCGQLIASLSDFLHHSVSSADYRHMPHAAVQAERQQQQQQRVWEAYWSNRFRETGGDSESSSSSSSGGQQQLGNALTRLDFLLDDVVFGGLYAATRTGSPVYDGDDDVESWRPQFIVRCLPRRRGWQWPASENHPEGEMENGFRLEKQLAQIMIDHGF